MHDQAAPATIRSRPACLDLTLVDLLQPGIVVDVALHVLVVQASRGTPRCCTVKPQADEADVTIRVLRWFSCGWLQALEEPDELRNVLVRSAVPLRPPPVSSVPSVSISRSMCWPIFRSTVSSGTPICLSVRSISSNCSTIWMRCAIIRRPASWASRSSARAGRVPVAGDCSLP